MRFKFKKKIICPFAYGRTDGLSEKWTDTVGLSDSRPGEQTDRLTESRTARRPEGNVRNIYKCNFPPF